MIQSKVAIIGAGLSGLTAAYRLHQKGIDVQVYEARKRLGGRILTARMNGQVVELGGQNIRDGGESKHLKKLIEEFDLSTFETTFSENTSYFDGEQFIPLKELLKKKNFDPKQLEKTIRELVSNSENLSQVVLGLMEKEDPLYQYLKIRLCGYEGGPLEKLSPLCANTLYNILIGQDPLVLGGRDTWESILGGNALLFEKIKEALPHRIHVKKELVELQKTDHFTLTFQDGSKAKADIILLTLPCSMYKKIAWNGQIPKRQLKDIQNIHYGLNSKILVQLPKKNSNFCRFVDQDMISFFEQNEKLLMIYYSGEKSCFSKDSIAKVFHRQHTLLEKGFQYHSKEKPIYASDEQYQNYQSPVGYSWPNDPYVFGSYSYIAKGQEDIFTEEVIHKGERVKKLFLPANDQLFFAGEHATILQEVVGSMEAASESGERAARMIAKSIGLS